MSQIEALLQPVSLGALKLSNRVLMAPLTRNRAHPNGVPQDMAIEYYRQRASAGLIITEATQISPLGKGYLNTPGIYNDAQAMVWKKIVETVHKEGGRIVLQLWHVGRISHVSLLPNGEPPVAPSAIAAKSQTFTANGFENTSEPRALSVQDIQSTIADYVKAAKLAREIGFDGVEVHGANGYLINQFLATNSNQRTDEYGGSPEARARFLLEVVDAVSKAIGADRTGLRLSPTGKFNDIQDEQARETYTYAIKELNKRKLAYLHFVERFPGFPVDQDDEALLNDLRNLWEGAYIANGDFDRDRGEVYVKEGRADAIAYGRPFIANPDLPERFAKGASLNEADQNTFYGGDEHGYTDYPFLDS